MLRHFEGRDLAEIAEILGIPVGTARSRLHHAHRAMRAALDADARVIAIGGRLGMTRDHDIERVLERWFTEGPTQMPDRLFEFVDHIDRVPQRRLARLMTRFVAMNTTLRLAAAAVVILIAGVAGVAFLTRPGDVGTGSSPTASAAPSVSAPPSPGAVVSPLEGNWATGPIPIADIKASMVAAGIAPGDADAWIAEVGSPTRYSFVLGFTETTFTHSEETPAMAMQVGEAGTFALAGTQLVLYTR